MQATTGICVSCNRAIRFWADKWFHLHNSVTFCEGSALTETHQPAAVAVPVFETEFSDFEEAL